MHPHYAPSHINCCCCNVRTGFQVLGWYWLFEMVIGLTIVWIPYFWIFSSVYILTFLLPFKAFLHWNKHKDEAESRHILYKHYMLCGIIIGIPAMFAA